MKPTDETKGASGQMIVEGGDISTQLNELEKRVQTIKTNGYSKLESQAIGGLFNDIAEIEAILNVSGPPEAYPMKTDADVEDIDKERFKRRRMFYQIDFHVYCQMIRCTYEKPKWEEMVRGIKWDASDSNTEKKRRFYWILPKWRTCTTLNKEKIFGSI
jgi:hypothetical protein